MKIIKNNDFREILMQAFREKEKLVVGYTMQQFADLLQMSSATLSMVISGKNGISPEKAHSISQLLGFSPEDQDYFVTLVSSQHHRSAEGRRAAKNRLKTKWGFLDFEELSVEDLIKFSDWSYFAILHLTELKDFKPDYEWIAGRLGLKVDKVKKTIEDLFQLGFLVESKDNKWVCDSNKLQITIKGRSEVLQKIHSQLIMKAHESVPKDFADRHLSTNFLTLSPEKMEIARGKITEFALALISELSDKPSDNDRVCALGIQLFNLDQSFASETHAE